VPPLPGDSTGTAMEAGIFHAAAGGVERIARRLAEGSPSPPRVFVTGGDGPLLHRALSLDLPVTYWPEQTLAGILHSAEALQP
jgi:pantothenate kinase type III